MAERVTTETEAVEGGVVIIESHYVEYLLPGFFMSEETSKAYEGAWPPDERGIQWALENAPPNAYCFSFGTSRYIEQAGERFRGKGTIEQGKFYIAGDVVDVDDLPDDEDHRILRLNARSNDWPRLVRCRTGNWQPFRDGDVNLLRGWAVAAALLAAHEEMGG